MKTLYIFNNFYLLSNKKYMPLSGVNNLNEIRLIFNTLQSTDIIYNYTMYTYEYTCTIVIVQARCVHRNRRAYFIIYYKFQ